MYDALSCWLDPQLVLLHRDRYYSRWLLKRLFVYGRRFLCCLDGFWRQESLTLAYVNAVRNCVGAISDLASFRADYSPRFCNSMSILFVIDYSLWTLVENPFITFINDLLYCNWGSCVHKFQI